MCTIEELQLKINRPFLVVLTSTFDSCIDNGTFVTEMKAVKDVYFRHNLAKTRAAGSVIFLWLGLHLRFRPYRPFGVNLSKARPPVWHIPQNGKVSSYEN
jgi:hypothetical protein